ncbi:hypothetical protein [Nocardia asiatica]|uniref:hypothetical protein n=1 Tax=Nocardia asiatica TaxID=209252 RepID=UPI003EE2E338
MAATELADVAETTPIEHRVQPLMQRVDEIAQLARDTAGGVTPIGEIATEFRQLADLGTLRTLAADTNGE